MKSRAPQAKHYNRPSTATTILAISVGVFVVGMTIASMFARSVAVQNEIDFTARLDQNVVAVQSQLAGELQGYNTVLRAAAAQFAARPDTTAEDWTKFYQTMNIDRQYPALFGLGYAEYLRGGGAAEEYGAWPEGVRDAYVRISYLEPQNEENTSSIGYDMFLEARRHEAIQLAINSGEPIMTAPVKLVQDKLAGSRYGSLIYLALYDGPSSTVPERQENVKGFVYLVFRPHDVMTSIVSNTPRLHDNSVVTLKNKSGNEELYRGDFLTKPDGEGRMASRDIATNHQTWTVTIAGRDQAISELYGPLGLFFLGGIVSAFVGFIVYAVLMYRLRRVERQYEEDVEQTKSELLALASHQLRTPASGVKQYLGILRDGSFGSLTPAQQSLADKAYATNERQLHVINDLLYVSKAEAGQLHMEPIICNLTEIVRDVISHMTAQAKQKDIEVVFKSSRAYKVVADDRYVTMIIENLISNAIKYSHPGSKVYVTLRYRAGAVHCAVRDSGVGVDMKDHERIFNKFDRVPNVLSHHEGGSGLGLYLARQLARGHGGDILIESTLDKGSTFTLVLPKVAMIDHDILVAAKDKTL